MQPSAWIVAADDGRRQPASIWPQLRWSFTPWVGGAILNRK
jgi:hypothetical protein